MMILFFDLNIQMTNKSDYEDLVWQEGIFISRIWEIKKLVAEQKEALPDTLYLKYNYSQMVQL